MRLTCAIIAARPTWSTGHGCDEIPRSDHRDTFYIFYASGSSVPHDGRRRRMWRAQGQRSARRGPYRWTSTGGRERSTSSTGRRLRSSIITASGFSGLSRSFRSDRVMRRCGHPYRVPPVTFPCLTAQGGLRSCLDGRRTGRYRILQEYSSGRWRSPVQAPLAGQHVDGRTATPGEIRNEDVQRTVKRIRCICAKADTGILVRRDTGHLEHPLRQGQNLQTT